MSKASSVVASVAQQFGHSLRLSTDCHGRFVGPMFSIVVHPVFYHFTMRLAFVARSSSRLSQLRSRAPGCFGPPKDCKLRTRSRDVFLHESLEL